MIYRRARQLLLCLVMLSLPAQALAQTSAQSQAVKTFAVAPFVVHGPEKYAYFSQGVPSMLATRLTWKDNVQPMDAGQVAQKIKSPVKSAAEAKSALASLGADYLVFGSLTVAGDTASTDVSIIDKAGAVVSKSAQAKINDLLPALETVSNDLAAQVFKRPSQTAQAGQAGRSAPAAGAMTPNPNLVTDQNDPSKPNYLNPNFRYVSGPDTPGAWRSQIMPFANSGMAIGDVAGDGKNQIVIMGEHDIQVFRFSNGQLAPIAQYKLSPGVLLVKVNILPQEGGRGGLIVVTGYREREPRSSILRLEGGKIVPVVADIKYYFNVVNIPPSFKPTLVVSKGEEKNVFQRGVYKAVVNGSKVELGDEISLPAKTNAMNFAYLPESGGYKIIVADLNDRLNVYSGGKELQTRSEDKYCGSGIGLLYDELMPSMYHPTEDDLESFYYVPLRILPVDIAGNGKYSVLVSKNISVASVIFQNFRAFSQGEVHSLFWDGVGLNLQWKTRRIKGTITDYALADFDNSGKKSLVVSINTTPGATGFAQRKTIVLAYSLDSESMVKGGGAYGNMEEANP
ncbi:MAG: VCBS repeat-containing protein [Desulfovibrionaceae bacterium]|nr:VCBS repeat-containing protein [Desulfovibrionaceae bacterium]MBF0514681.1 VCBS repeat-containing protein [Desulfovibrionaceae bacterium]